MTIYFIASPTGHIKVGFTESSDPAPRLSGLQTGCPVTLEILAHCPGTNSDERRVHQMLAAHRTTGEWFTATREVLAVVAYVRSFNSLEGAETALADPGSIASFAKSFGSLEGFDYSTELTIEENKWQLRKDEAKLFNGPYDLAFDWRDVMRIWRSACSLDDSRFIVGPKSGSVFEEIYWIENAKQRARFFSAKAGVEATAWALAKAKTDDELVAIWLTACAKELYGRGDFLEEDLVKRIPRIKELMALTRQHTTLSYHSRCTSVLPILFPLPIRCVCDLDDFVRLCALTRCAVWTQYSIIVDVRDKYIPYDNLVTQ